LCRDPSQLRLERLDRLEADEEVKEALQKRSELFWQHYDQAYGIDINRTTPLNYFGESPVANFFGDQPGDFILATRSAWRRIGGAPMLLQSHLVDVLVVCRLATFLRQVVLAAPCFSAHLNHRDVMHEAGNLFDKDLRRDNLWQRCRDPYRTFPSELGSNRGEWGFPRLELPEHTLMFSGGRMDVYRLTGSRSKE